jgi:hypothetical protein
LKQSNSISKSTMSCSASRIISDCLNRNKFFKFVIQQTESQSKFSN